MKRTCLLTTLIVFASITGISAQTIEDSVLRAKDRSSDIKNRSNELERMRREADTPVKPASHEIRFPEIKEDFEQIQLNNFDLQPSAALPKPDFRVISKAAGEIVKHAFRLQSNLFTSEPKRKSKKKSDKADENNPPFDLKTQANQLEAAIAGFVKSPMFQNIQVVNSEDSQRAQKELENIIKLSADIQRHTINR